MPPTDTLGRLAKVVAIANGEVFTSFNGDTSWASTNNNSSGTPPVSATAIPYSAVSRQKVFFVDGTHYVYLDPSDNSLNDWTPTAGQLPVDAQGNRARLICNWRGRVVLSGLKLDPQNWFMSKKDDPFDWDYFPATVTPDQAVAGNDSQAGEVGDTITCLIPFSDDVLIIGGDHSIYLVRGDPMEGGRIDMVTNTIGIRFGMPWCQGPDGTVYFTSVDYRVYSFVPGGQPEPISLPVDAYLTTIPTDPEVNARADSLVRMAWNHKYCGFHWYFIPNPTGQTGGVVHLFWEQRSNAWWQWQHGDPTRGVDGSYLDPVSLAVYDGPDPTDRTVLLGCWDGWVRAVDPQATTDDGLAISTGVWIGPLLTPNMDEMLLKEVQAELADGSAAVAFDVYAARSPEGIGLTTVRKTGLWQAGRTQTHPVRTAGHVVYLFLRCSDRWAINWVRGLAATQGKTRLRQR